MVKRWLVILLLVLTLFCGMAQAEESNYIYRPEKTEYTLFYEGKPIYIHFLDTDQYREKIKELYNFYYEEVIGVTVIFRKDRVIDHYEIYLPRDYKRIINLEILGHELAHVFSEDWHL